jgi:glycosyltransferase involved in cell wall biosynthesis
LKVIIITPFDEFSKGGISTHIRNFKKHFLLFGVDSDVYVLNSNRLKAFYEIIKIAFKGGDIIHVHSSFFAVYCLSIFKVFSSSNYFFTFHTQPNESNATVGRYFKYVFLKFLLNNFFHVTTVSESIIKNYKLKLGLNIYEYVVIHSGVDHVNSPSLAKKNKSDNLNIISIGLFEWDWKVNGHLLALRAFHRLNLEFQNLSFILIGSGSKEFVIIDEINNLNLSSSVKILNNISDVKEVLVNGDIYLHTGLNEGCSLAILEARSFNLCTIVVDSAGNNELIINNVNGILCEASVDGIYNSLRNTLVDNDILNRLKKDSKLDLSRFQWGNIVQQYIIAYNNCIFKN